MSVGRAIELWGGVEGTVNRVGDRYFDQLERNGHAHRADDLERFASLGVRALRYPLLWERVAPDGVARADWSWPDARLARLRALGVRPIAGLVHHGSGPRSTSLVDPGFAPALAAYARAVAERYPWLEDYTPLNEPLTTARFSGLYGHWYPHGRDSATFARALVVQCRATVLAMREVRAVNPRARLVQTEDFGETRSTPRLAYAADFENGRRCLGVDLLCGRVDRAHAFWPEMLAWGIGEAELDFFLERPCPPDVLGINYYITSDRWLDERVQHYPRWSHGGNERDAYADVETARARLDWSAGQRALLERLWQRYGLPLALTEVHMGSCGREAQLRWLVDAWRAAHAARDAGVDVRAFTVWSLLGAFDWNSLVTRDAGFYEPGAFDVRGGAPRETAIAPLVRALASGARPEHPVLAVPGWWQRPARIVFGPDARDVAPPAAVAPRADEPGARPVVITGATGTLGRAFARVCAERGLPYRLLGRAEMDIADPASVAHALAAIEPWAVINAAGYVRVDDAERDRVRCERENARGPAVLAAACREIGARLATFSTDLVFDGATRRPYVETDRVAPLGVYGRAKARGERAVLHALPSALVVRTSAFFGPWDAHNFVAAVTHTLARGEAFRAASDQTVSPTFVPDLVHTVLDLMIDGERGLWHLANRDALSWADLARAAATRGGYDPSRIERVPGAALHLRARRPSYSALGSERAVLLPGLDDALQRYFAQCEAPPSAGHAGSRTSDQRRSACG